MIGGIGVAGPALGTDPSRSLVLVIFFSASAVSPRGASFLTITPTIWRSARAELSGDLADRRLIERVNRPAVHTNQPFFWSSCADHRRQTDLPALSGRRSMLNVWSMARRPLQTPGRRNPTYFAIGLYRSFGVQDAGRCFEWGDTMSRS